jgi:hypothetical protein
MYYYKKTVDGKTTTVESYSHNLWIEGAEPCTKQEYDNFIAAMPEPEPEPVIDHKAEIAKLKHNKEKLEYLIENML